MKQRIYHFVEKGAHGSKVNLIFDYFIITLILLNVSAAAVGTLNSLGDPIRKFLVIFEIFSIIIFTIEYLMRLYVSDITHPAKNKFSSALKFVFSGYGIIDLLAILPFYIPFIIKADLRFLRILRLIRFFRILKISRYSSSLKLIRDVLKEKRAALQTTFFIASLLLLVSAFTIYYVENAVQPELFSNLFAALWWAVATLTTVGYGDMVPLTVTGKLISSAVALLGIGVVAIPTGIISAGFIEKIKHNSADHKKHTCPHCGEEI
jgi:voltage-gated potassium channel